ncbi:MAG: hypothetical protein HYT22_02925 [Candidatus Niyogibacteria bacterium]|nr:hypothetical protein [Candidatus Niyogibacteria bacterium]
MIENRPAIIFVVAAFAIGVGAGVFFSGGITGISEQSAKEIAARLQEKGLLFPQDFVGNSLEGVVKNIRGNQLTFAPSRPAAVDVILGREDARTVSIEGATIVRRTDLTPEEFAAENARFARAPVGGDGAFVEPPAFFKEAPASREDITEGASILVEATEEIGARTAITASRIVILPVTIEIEPQ